VIAGAKMPYPGGVASPSRRHEAATWPNQRPLMCVFFQYSLVGFAETLIKYTEGHLPTSLKTQRFRSHNMLFNNLL
jgi:hypothetical protein